MKKNQFQSHAGSIEAHGDLGGCASDSCCFNPTLVRLRRGAGRRPADPGAPFQSHAGSIEAQPPRQE